MEKRIQIGLVGDFDKNMYTHVALNDSIGHCKPHLHFTLEEQWIPTETIDENFLASHPFEAFWLTPGSPYKNDEGVYRLIRWARENNFPLFGTCGGFQYMLVEYARNVLKMSQAGHEENEPANEHLIISKLSCSLKGKSEEVVVSDRQSWLYQVLDTERFTAQFNCNFGLNPVYQKILDQYPLTFTAFSPDGEARAFELKAHRFYAATLFQPPLDSTREKPNPLVLDFLRKSSHP
jgi:CTP synthase (UTP-ammonia lyase)